MAHIDEALLKQLTQQRLKRSSIFENLDYDKITDLLMTMSFEELSYTIGRYAGTQNAALAEKKFGFPIPKALAQKVYDRRFVNETFQNIVLEDDTQESDKIEE